MYCDGFLLGNVKDVLFYSTELETLDWTSKIRVIDKKVISIAQSSITPPSFLFEISQLHFVSSNEGSWILYLRLYEEITFRQFVVSDDPATSKLDFFHDIAKI